MLQIPKRPDETSNATPMDDSLYEAYTKCIESHQSYGKKHRYDVILDEANISGRLAYWQKILSLSRIMYDALEKDNREYDWLFWTDSDTLILDDEIQLETFLPPERPELQDDEKRVHILMARDHRGWNNGVFFIRVHPWSLAFLLRSYTYPDYNTRFRSFDQSAMARLYENYEDVRHHIISVPMRWFNDYPSGWINYNARQGDLQIHFPGSANKNVMIDRVMPNYFVKLPPVERPKNTSGAGPTNNQLSVMKFWDQIALGTIKRGQVYPHQ